MNLNQTDAESIMPLLAAVFGSETDRNALYLINEAGVDVNVRSKLGLTPPMQAARKGCKALVARGANVDAVMKHGETALGYAVRVNHMEAALYLLEEAGAAWDHPHPRYLLSTVAEARFFGFIPPLLRHVRSKGKSVENLGRYLVEAAHAVIAKGFPLACLEALMEEGGWDVTRARASIEGGRKIPLFHAACHNARIEVMAFLLEQGCDPKGPQDGAGLLPQHIAAAQGHVGMLQWLHTAASIDINARSTKRPSMTMLHLAAMNGHMAVVQWLVGQGADVRLLCEGRACVRASCTTAFSGHPAIAAYLREQELAADARDESEEATAEAAVRRARNERRRRQKKKGKARRRAADGSDGAAGESDAGGEDEEEGQEQQEQELAAAMAGLSAGDDTAATGAEEVGDETAVAEEQEPVAAATPAPAAPDPDELELAAAIALSLSPDRPPPLEEYLEADAPDGLLCPISFSLLDDPVVLAADGITYSRAAIEQHFAFCRERGKPLSSPSTNVAIMDAVGALLVPNVMARGQVPDFKAAKERTGAEAERRWQNAAAAEGEGAN